ncbi:DUF6766 family protein [Arcticibacter eurypsychrophilus]|uniref:DUF6766 family protein n=1 Tax=Arcticibacter eurypsychrophilus TaxID=1434752 RepID=UPI00084D9721|nr:DUF6766 family protein [Arcticibacter eurypsychrophilus]
MSKHSYFYRNGLSIVFLSLFIVTLAAQALTGWKEHNKDLSEAHIPILSLLAYLGTGHFISATFENFQSEFLQMSLYVVLTIHLRQQGSAESKKLEGKDEVDRDPKPEKDAPWAVRKGGWILKVYSYSLSLVFFLLFFISWGLHLYGSWIDHNVQQEIHHQSRESIVQFLSEPTFWFETFQNWQSEFLSVASIVILTIYFRQKGSPESKPVDASDVETGK